MMTMDDDDDDDDGRRGRANSWESAQSAGKSRTLANLAAVVRMHYCLSWLVTGTAPDKPFTKPPCHGTWLTHAAAAADAARPRNHFVRKELRKTFARRTPGMLEMNRTRFIMHVVPDKIQECALARVKNPFFVRARSKQLLELELMLMLELVGVGVRSYFKYAQRDVSSTLAHLHTCTHTHADRK